MNTFEEWLRWRVSVLAVCMIPLFFSVTGYDTFRLPKELLLRATGILLGATILIGAIWKRGALLRTINLRRMPEVLVVAILSWTLLTTFLSTKRQISVLSLSWVLSAALLFLCIERSAGSASPFALIFGFVPACVNALLAMLQEFRIWNPFFSADIVYGPGRLRLSGHWATIALLGNTNDVGTYLIGPFACAMAAAVGCRRWRPLWIIIAVVLLGGVLASQAATSIVATAAAIFSLMFLLPRRKAIGLLAGFAFAAVLIAVVPSPLKQRYASMRQFVRDGRYDELFSGRLVAVLSAWEMFKDHSLIGVGPGAYGFQYFDYQQTVARQYAPLFGSGVSGVNFGETHNDHLQVLATTGMVGYALMVAAAVYVASRSFTRHIVVDERAQFARYASLPLTITFAVSALGQFPLELAAPVSAYMFFGAVCVAWSTETTSQ